MITEQRGRVRLLRQKLPSDSPLKPEGVKRAGYLVQAG
jgi:hypothetical protein